MRRSGVGDFRRLLRLRWNRSMHEKSVLLGRGQPNIGQDSFPIGRQWLEGLGVPVRRRTASAAFSKRLASWRRPGKRVVVAQCIVHGSRFGIQRRC